MKQKSIICIYICLCYFALIGCAAVNSQNYSEKSEKSNEKVQNYVEKDQKYKEKNQEYKEKDREYKEKNNTHFENFDSEVKGNKYIVSGTAILVEDDKNAVLVKISTSAETRISITGSIKFKSGEVALYLVSPDLKEKCILSGKDIKENEEIKKVIDLDVGYNKIIFMGYDSIVDFDFEFVSEDTHSSILYD